MLTLTLGKEATDQSLPSRERGLKCIDAGLECLQHPVAPLAGAWIEIHRYMKPAASAAVAPLAGAWIEILSP